MLNYYITDWGGGVIAEKYQFDRVIYCGYCNILFNSVSTDFQNIVKWEGVCKIFKNSIYIISEAMTRGWRPKQNHENDTLFVKIHSSIAKIFNLEYGNFIPVFPIDIINKRWANGERWDLIRALLYFT